MKLPLRVTSNTLVLWMVLVSVSALVLVSTESRTNNVYAHEFKSCSSGSDQDHLKIDSFTLKPDEPTAGKNLEVEFSGIPDVDVTSGQASMSLKMMGLHIGTVKFDVCSELGVSCPLQKNERFTGKVSYEVPEHAPTHVEIDVTLKVEDDKGDQLSCLSSHIQLESSSASTAHYESQDSGNTNAQDAPMVEGCHFGWSENQVKFMFTRWLDQFASLVRLPEGHNVFDDNLKTSNPQVKSRLRTFRDNLVTIAKHNREFRKNKATYGMAVNQFAHLSRDEFASERLGYWGSEGTARYAERLRDRIVDFATNTAKRLRSKIVEIPVARSFFGFHDEDDKFLQETEKPEPTSLESDAPDSIDWVENGAVSPVKDQGACGSCWAFSAVGALESAYYLKYGVLKQFSEQELVSCDGTCHGCGGGLMDLAYEWIEQVGGLCTEEAYPYKSGSVGMNGWCKKRTCKPDPKSVPKQVVDVEKSEVALRQAVAQQPVAIAIEADQPAFQFYSGEGVVTGVCGDNLDHGVLLVGYGELDGIKFWKVKNSWGPSWGKEGYILLERGKETPNEDGECGILANPSYPVL